MDLLRLSILYLTVFIISSVKVIIASDFGINENAKIDSLNIAFTLLLESECNGLYSNCK